MGWDAKEGMKPHKAAASVRRQGEDDELGGGAKRTIPQTTRSIEWPEKTMSPQVTLPTGSISRNVMFNAATARRRGTEVGNGEEQGKGDGGSRRAGNLATKRTVPPVDLAESALARRQRVTLRSRVRKAGNATIRETRGNRCAAEARERGTSSPAPSSSPSSSSV